MKSILLVSLLLLGLVSSVSAEYVRGYTKSDGTYVKGYHRSSANHTKRDNYSTKGNINPYTGKAGTKTYDDYNNYGSSKQKKSTSQFGY